MYRSYTSSPSIPPSIDKVTKPAAIEMARGLADESPGLIVQIRYFRGLISRGCLKSILSVCLHFTHTPRRFLPNDTKAARKYTLSRKCWETVVGGNFLNE